MARSPRTRDGLIEAIYKMVGDQTWNVAPVNYTVAERAVEMTERYYGITAAHKPPDRTHREEAR